MDHLTHALETKLAQQEAESRSQREADALRERVAEAEDFERLTRLRDNPDVAWLFGERIAPMQRAERDRALDITLTPEQRTAAAQRHALAVDIAGLIEREWIAADNLNHG